MTSSASCKLLFDNESKFDKFAACPDGPICVFPSCPLVPTVLGSRRRHSSLLRVAETCELTLLLAISVTCKRLSDDEPRFAKFAACSDALVVAFSRCSAVPTVLGSCCRPSPLQFAETGKVALLSATFATCQLLADCETRFSPVAATVCSEPKCVFFGCPTVPTAPGSVC